MIKVLVAASMVLALTGCKTAGTQAPTNTPQTAAMAKADKCMFGLDDSYAECVMKQAGHDVPKLVSTTKPSTERRPQQTQNNNDNSKQVPPCKRILVTGIISSPPFYVDEIKNDYSNADNLIKSYPLKCGYRYWKSDAIPNGINYRPSGYEQECSGFAYFEFKNADIVKMDNTKKGTPYYMITIDVSSNGRPLYIVAGVRQADAKCDN